MKNFIKLCKMWEHHKVQETMVTVPINCQETMVTVPINCCPH